MNKDGVVAECCYTCIDSLCRTRACTLRTRFLKQNTTGQNLSFLPTCANKEIHMLLSIRWMI